MATDQDFLLQLRAYSLARQIPAGSQTILHSIDLDVRRGRWLAVLGANGSGKSSLLKFLASDESPLQSSRAIMFQDPDEQIIAKTVERELLLGRPGLMADPILDEYSLGELGDLDPRLLSAGQKQRLVLAVSLAGQPEVLFCDEPTALQDLTQADWMLDHLTRWCAEPQHTLVTATCDVREAERADDLLVLKEGKVLLAGPRDDLWDEPVVCQLLGRQGAPPQAKNRVAAGDDGSPEAPVLELEEVGFRFMGSSGGFGPVGMKVYPGTRLGITGPNGCGKSTLLAACVGARKPDRGQVILSGQSLYQKGLRDLDHGLALLAPQFPEYLFTRANVAEEWALDPALAALDCSEHLSRLGLPEDLASRDPHSLSSGQKRRLALGLVVFSARPLILLDEPTAGLDTTGRRQLLELLDHLPPTTAVVIASHDEEFLDWAGCSAMKLD